MAHLSLKKAQGKQCSRSRIKGGDAILSIEATMKIPPSILNVFIVSIQERSIQLHFWARFPWDRGIPIIYLT